MFLRKTHYNFSSLFMNLNRKSIHLTMRTRKPWKKNNLVKKNNLLKCIWCCYNANSLLYFLFKWNGLFTLQPNIDVSHLQLTIYNHNLSLKVVFLFHSFLIPTVLDQGRCRKSKIENDQNRDNFQSNTDLLCFARPCSSSQNLMTGC